MSNINWLADKTQSLKAPSVTPDAEGTLAKFNKTLARVAYYDWRFETKHYVISLPEYLTWDSIVAVNKNNYRVDFQDHLVFPAQYGAPEYLAYKLAACLRFVDWIKQKEKSPFLNTNPKLAALLDDEAIDKLKIELADYEKKNEP